MLVKHCFAAIVLIVCFSVISLTRAQQRGVSVRISNDRDQIESVKLYDGSYALIIGAINYKSWNRLSGVQDDVPAVRTVLENLGFTVEVLLDPTGDNLLPRINKFVNDHGFQTNNRLLMYFSGHGYTEVAEDGRKIGYIVPVDAPKPQRDLVGFQQKALTMDEIETVAKRIRSKHALFVFDSCFSGTLINRGEVRVPHVIDYYAARPVRQFITAGADNQEVPEESVFRRVFVRGLEGEADANKDHYVTGSELAMYLQDQVGRYRGTSQTPQYGKIRDPRLDSGDFIFPMPEAWSQTRATIPSQSSSSEGFENDTRQSDTTGKLKVTSPYFSLEGTLWEVIITSLKDTQGRSRDPMKTPTSIEFFKAGKLNWNSIWQYSTGASGINKWYGTWTQVGEAVHITIPRQNGFGGYPSIIGRIEGSKITLVWNGRSATITWEGKRMK
jgi:hypothetical protein